MEDTDDIRTEAIPEDDIDEIEMGLSLDEDGAEEVEPEPFIEGESNDVGPQPIIIEAIKGGENAFTDLITHPWMIHLLNEISAWAEWKYRQEKEDIRQILLMKLYLSISTLNNPRLLRSWCYRIVAHYCLNQIRHMVVVNSYRQSFKRQIKESTRQGGRPLVQSTAAPAQEQELLKKERNILLEKIVRMDNSSFPPEMVDLWLKGKTPNEISEALKMPVKTVYGKLKKMEKQFIEAQKGLHGDANNT